MTDWFPISPVQLCVFNMLTWPNWHLKYYTDSQSLEKSKRKTNIAGKRYACVREVIFEIVTFNNLPGQQKQKPGNSPFKEV